MRSAAKTPTAHPRRARKWPYALGDMPIFPRPTLPCAWWRCVPAAEQSLSVRDLLRGLATHWGFGGEGEYLRIETAQFHESGLLKLNCDKALALLGWRPVLDAAETVRLTAAWYAHFYRGKNN